MMKFKNLKQIFINQANDVFKKKDKNYSFRFRSYKAVAQIISQTYGDDINVTNNRINQLDITNHMKNKAIDYYSIFKNSPNEQKIPNNIINDISLYPGMTYNSALNLIRKFNIKSVRQLRNKKVFNTLNKQTKAFITTNPNRKIPRNVIKNIENKLKKYLGYNFIIVGSYRRGLSYSKDIDIMIVSDNKKILDKILIKLKNIFNGGIYLYNKGKDKMSVIINYNNDNYKLDIFRTSKINKIPMLLYSTGSKNNNINMRAKAKKLGFRLNQKGLFRKTNTDNLVKISGLNTEESYYVKLGMQYKQPKNRN